GGFVLSLWWLVLVRLVLPPVFASPPGWPYWVLPAADSSAPTAAQSAALESSPEPRVRISERPEGVPENRGLAPMEPEPAGQADATPPPVLAAAPQARSWAAYFMLAWGGIAGTLLVLLALGSHRVTRWVREAEPIDDPGLYASLEECRDRLAIGRLIELRNSQECTTPVVVGFRRPVILLPKSVLAQLDEVELRAVLLHELFHIARGDTLVNLAQGILG